MDKLTRTALKARPGWTDAAIRRFAPEPELRRNPYNVRLPPMQLYDPDEIGRIERTEAFREHLAAHRRRSEARKRFLASEPKEERAKRQAAMREGHERRTRAAMKIAEDIPIEIERVEGIVDIALAAAKEERIAMGWPPAPKKDRRLWAHKAVLFHIVNEHTNFRELHGKFRSVHKSDAVSGILRTRVCEAIDEVYPELGLYGSDDFKLAMMEFGADVPGMEDYYDF